MTIGQQLPRTSRYVFRGNRVQPFAEGAIATPPCPTRPCVLHAIAVNLLSTSRPTFPNLVAWRLPPLSAKGNEGGLARPGDTMIVTVCSFKGGVAKTTSAVHVAAHFSRSGPTLLVDADANRSALVWARHSRLPFTVVDERQAARAVRDLQPHHTVIDTRAPGPRRHRDARPRLRLPDRTDHARRAFHRRARHDH